MHFEDDFPFPKVGYVNSLEGIYINVMGGIWSDIDFGHHPNRTHRGFPWHGLPRKAVIVTGPSNGSGLAPNKTP